MPELFKKILNSSETLFKNELALDSDFTPKIIPFRESENQYIATCIRPLFHKRTGKNLIINGAPGIGKTLATKSVLIELEKETDEIIPIYINCWKKNTTYQVVLELCNAIDFKFTQNKRTDELISIITERLNKKSSVIALDEIDKIEEINILYNLAENLYRKTILLITNDKSWLSRLDPRLRSRLILDQLEFKPYTLEETKDILKQRVNYAFHQNVLDKEGLNKIAEQAFKMKDIRVGLSLLKESAEIAELNSSKSIKLDHIESAIEKIADFDKGRKLDNDEKQILDIIKNNSDKTTGELFRIFKETYGRSERTFQRKIKNLEKLNLIKLDEIENMKGRSFKIKPLTEF